MLSIWQTGRKQTLTNPLKNMELITRAQAAKALNVSTSTIYNWTRAKKIPHYKIGPRLVRYEKNEIQEFAERIEKK